MKETELQVEHLTGLNLLEVHLYVPIETEDLIWIRSGSFNLIRSRLPIQRNPEYLGGSSAAAAAPRLIFGQTDIMRAKP